jgi:hypothetical protein
MCRRFWWEIPKERDYSKDRVVEGRMGSKWILGGLARRRSCEQGDELSVSGATKLVFFVYVSDERLCPYFVFNLTRSIAQE